MRKALIFIIALTVGFLALFYVTGSGTPGSCEVQAVVDGQYTRVALERIRGARKTIDLMMFELVYYPGKRGPSNRLIKALSEAKKKGVRVRVLMEGGESFLGRRFAEKVFRTTEVLRNFGIDVRYDRNGETMHSKLLVIDSLWVLIGSTNWSYYSLTRNRETDVLIKSSHLAVQFIRYFERFWH